MFVVFDLDGTLSCCKHRAHLLEVDPRPWDEFYRACVLDPPIKPIINTMRAFREAGAHIEIWTGRSDLVEKETREWLDVHGAPYTPLRMRPHGDHSSDVEMKRFWLHDHFERFGKKPDLVFEDRARVVAMWREEGIYCAQVDVGDF